MKTFAIIFVLGFVSQVSYAFMPEDKEACLVANGFTTSENDMALVDAIADPGLDLLKDVSKEKLADVLACLYPKAYKKTGLYDYLKYLIDVDDKITEDQHQEMVDTLTLCKTQAAGNDAELLKCVKAIEPPFDYLIATLRDLGEEALLLCYSKCEMKIPDLFTLETYEKKIDELLSRLGKNKLYCITACKVDREDDPKQILYNVISEAINLKTEFPNDKKKEMKDITEKCFTEAKEKAKQEKEGNAEVKRLEESTELVKCVKLFDEPFLDLLRH